MTRGLFAAGREATARALARASYTIRRVVALGGTTVVYDGTTVTGPIVWITDDGVGKSVTNDAERVCVELDRRYPGHRIIYRDTDGNWDELIVRNGEFAGFSAARHLAI